MMNRPLEDTAMRKRSMGSLKPPGGRQEQGEGCSFASSPAAQEQPVSRSRSSRSTFKTAATLALVALLLTALLYLTWPVPYINRRPPRPFGYQSPVSSRLDHVLKPEQHSHRSPTTLSFEWHVTSGRWRPDGVLKEAYLINGEFLGPTIECRSGDRLVINVTNLLMNDGIALHWHGLTMRDQNRQDGAVGFTQDAIEPGASHTYDFIVDEKQHGTFWYHAHDGVQRADGLFGGLIVHRPAEDSTSEMERYNYDEEHLLIIGDWYHRTAKDVMAWYMRAASFGNEPVPDSILLNGRGSYNCSLAVPARPLNCVETQAPSLHFRASKTYRLRIVNTGNLAGFSLRADTLSMKAIEVDGGNTIEGSAARSVGIIYPGQRVDLLVSVTTSASQDSGLEVILDRTNFRYPNPALGDSHFYPIDIQEHGNSSGVTKPASLLFDLADAQGVADVKPGFATQANLTLVLYSTSAKKAHLGNKPYGFVNKTSWQPHVPHLLSVPREEWEEHQFVPQLNHTPKDDNFWVDIVLNNLDDGSHPFHIHGYDMWLLQTHAGSGWGSWNPFQDPTPPGGPLEVQRPVKRDTFLVPKRGYIVLRFKPDNPGIWMFHCHILWHQASGMAMGLQVGDVNLPP